MVYVAIIRIVFHLILLKDLNDHRQSPRIALANQEHGHVAVDSLILEFELEKLFGFNLERAVGRGGVYGCGGAGQGATTPNSQPI